MRVSRNAFGLAVSLIASTFVFTTNGQDVLSTKVPHVLNGASFQTTARYEERNIKNLPPNTMVFAPGAGDEAVFIVVPGEKTVASDLITQLRKAALADLLPNEPQKFEWKSQDNDYIQKAGKYDVDRGKVMGFNGESRVMIEYHQISHKNKDIIVGYYYVMDKGARAGAAFARGLGGGNGAAGNECASVVSSITGEKERETSVGQPPPPAAPPRIKN
jgi:hypothetical protein